MWKKSEIEELRDRIHREIIAEVGETWLDLEHAPCFLSDISQQAGLRGYTSLPQITRTFEAKKILMQINTWRVEMKRICESPITEKEEEQWTWTRT